MNTNIKRGVCLIALAWTLGALTACNTVEGAGKDLEAAGEEMQEESQEHQDTDD